MSVARRTLKVLDDRGASAVEYGLLVALIAGVIIAVVILLGDNVAGLFSDAYDSWEDGSS
jgi:pilus assembly protein Flp/PilA